ncbi:hypothetical protein OG625_25225 [Streptomyces sp. NBC_01351]|uniref:hypothetical protein n=1 Tax=Streptomyces sp. NBC_01351 TaxID=2903833 RepID=UPI002E346BB8|nr:hypothetical protein [Streptomyces sp. NBC_01351]
MISSVQPPRPRRRRQLRAALVTATLAASLTVPAALNAQALAAVQLCSTATALDNSRFEIDTSANLVVNGGAGCIDWLTGGTNTPFRTGVLVKPDLPSGSNDDAFGRGSKEDDPDPFIVPGSVPPNKSDLKNFGVFTEQTTTPKFLELFWQRVNSPQGTTNMDFELNQKFCDLTQMPTNCANNGTLSPPETPVRTIGDKLITYDLSQGGTVPAISIRTWSGTAWGPATIISGTTNPLAVGSVNTNTIPANQTGGLSTTALSPFTFGEAAISYNALFPPGSSCTTFGSAYVKSRSSDSFTSELKDFISPEPVQITNCTSLITSATPTATVGDTITDTATLGGASATAGGSISFNLYSNATCTTLVQSFGPIAVNGPGQYTTSPGYTTTAAGTYYWRAFYTGDPNNQAASTPCQDADETTVVRRTEPSISTQLLNAQGNPISTATIGDFVHDSASLSGATTTAGGTVTYAYYTDAACSLNRVQVGSPVTVTNGVVPNSAAAQFNQVGTFYWQATYSGDANNMPAMSACTSEPLTVGKAPANLLTRQRFLPQDTATVTAQFGGQPTGTVTFDLYGPNNNNCSTNKVGTWTGTLSGSGVAQTNNTNFYINASNQGEYKWLATYSGDATHNSATSTCGTENSTIAIDNGL